jgi:hypothetical protein
MNRQLLIGSTVLAGILLQSAAGDKVEMVPLPGSSPPTLVGVYQADAAFSWHDAGALATSVGGTLFVPGTPEEIDLISGLSTSIGGWECVGPWLGASREPSLDPLEQGWVDSFGGRISSLNWSGDQPIGSRSLHWKIALDARDSSLETWVNVLPDPDAGPAVRGCVFLVDDGLADCDGDGRPDIVEIVMLGVADVDGDGVPDSCGLPGDLDGDGAVDGLDLSILLGHWGGCPGTGTCVADVNGDRIVDGVDLSVLLGSWTG